MNSRRDVEMLLLGVALVKSERKRVLDAFPDGAFSDEIGSLIADLRQGKKIGRAHV